MESVILKVKIGEIMKRLQSGKAVLFIFVAKTLTDETNKIQAAK